MKINTSARVIALRCFDLLDITGKKLQGRKIIPAR